MATLVDVTGLIIYFSVALVHSCAAQCFNEGQLSCFRSANSSDTTKNSSICWKRARSRPTAAFIIWSIFWRSWSRANSPHNLAAFAESRREDKRITQELTEELSKTFITPLEREDIQALAAALYKIPKTVEKIGERILICPEDLHGHNFRQQVELLDQAAEAVLAMVKQLRKGTDIETARDMNARLQTIEGDADKLELELLRDLYHGDYDAKHIIFLRDLYELLEKVIDRCRDAGNIILQVV